MPNCRIAELPNWGYYTRPLRRNNLVAHAAGEQASNDGAAGANDAAGMQAAADDEDAASTSGPSGGGPARTASIPTEGAGAKRERSGTATSPDSPVSSTSQRPVRRARALYAPPARRVQPARTSRLAGPPRPQEQYSANGLQERRQRMGRNAGAPAN